MEITVRYKVSLPSPQTEAHISLCNVLTEEEPEYNELVERAFNGDEDSQLHLTNVLAFFVLENFHVGDYTDIVEEIDAQVTKYTDRDDTD